MLDQKSTPEKPLIISDGGAEIHRISAMKMVDGGAGFYASRIPKLDSGRTDNVQVVATPEELLQFTRDLAEMQGYALVNATEYSLQNDIID